MALVSKNFTTIKPAMQRLFDRLSTFFKPKPTHGFGYRLYAACVDQARLPVFYATYGVEDAIGARFELLTFHVGLVIERLKAVTAADPRRGQAQEIAQALFDAFLEALDNTLREQGTGDLSVPKKMKKIGAVIYTRMKRWEDLWSENAAARADYAARTIFAGDDDEAGAADTIPHATLGRAALFAAYGAAARAGLDIDALLDGRVEWAAAPVADVA